MLRYTELARQGKTGWKAYLLSIVTIIFFYLFLGGFFTGFVSGIINASGRVKYLAEYINLNIADIFLLAGLYISLKHIHKRKFKTLITPYSKVSFGRICYGFSIYFFLILISTVIEYFIHPKDFSFTLDYSLLFKSLSIILVFTLIQTTTEELLFRGYVIQLLGLFLKSNILLAVISGIIFAVPHFLNPEMANGFFIMALNYFAYGFLLAIVTFKSNTLEIAIGVHAANNLFCALIVNYENSVI